MLLGHDKGEELHHTFNLFISSLFLLKHTHKQTHTHTSLPFYRHGIDINHRTDLNPTPTSTLKPGLTLTQSSDIVGPSKMAPLHKHGPILLLE